VKDLFCTKVVIEGAQKELIVSLHSFF